MAMSNRRALLAAAGGIAVLGAAGVGLAYFVLFAGAAPGRLTLNPATTASPAASLESPQTVGEWTVAKDSVAGYRVREQLVSVGAPSDAVGRTSAVTGAVTINQAATGSTVTAATFTVEVSTLTSDRPLRDQRIHRIGLESDRYPKATFRLGQPVALPATATTGQTVEVKATGELTIHGTTRSVTIPMSVRLTGSLIEAVGSITFAFRDFGMDPPSIAGFVSVQDNATMEFHLFLQPG